MALSNKAQQLLDQFAAESGDFTLFGLMTNPATGEIGTFCSHAIEPGHVLSFLNRGVALMMDAAADGTLQGVEHGEARPGPTTKGIPYVH